MRISYSLTLVALFIAPFASALPSHETYHYTRLDAKRASSTSSPTSFNAGFNVANVVSVAERLASHSWEYGTLAEALLELYNPEDAVYATSTAFPNGKIPAVTAANIPSLSYVKSKFVLGDGTLSSGDGANGDPASLGVSAVLIGEQNATIKAAAASQIKHLFAAPRFYNGAISQRNSVAELWADGSSMIMPYMAYYGAASNNKTMVIDAADQILLYRNVLLANTTQSWNGLWVHIVGPQSQTKGIWATGNGWAALGMARVLATIKAWPNTTASPDHINRLQTAMMAIFNGLTGVDTDPSTHLLRNYLIGDSNDQTVRPTVPWFGDASGSAALVAAALRLAVLEPSQCSFLYNASRPIRNAVIKAINSNGTASPTVNPLDWYTRTSYTAGSPEGQAFIINMYSAWRDCVSNGCCPQPNNEPSQVGQTYKVWGGTIPSSSSSTTKTTSSTSSSVKAAVTSVPTSSTTTTTQLNITTTAKPSSSSSSSTAKTTSSSSKASSTSSAEPTPTLAIASRSIRLAR